MSEANEIDVINNSPEKLHEACLHGSELAAKKLTMVSCHQKDDTDVAVIVETARGRATIVVSGKELMQGVASALTGGPLDLEKDKDPGTKVNVGGKGGKGGPASGDKEK